MLGPGDSFGLRAELVNTDKSRASVDGSQERYTISLAPSSASLSAAFRAQSRSRRIQHDEFRFFIRFFQKLFRMFIVRDDCDARDLCVGVEIPRRGEIRIHTHDSLERLASGNVKNPTPELQIQSQRATRIGRHGFQQILDQETVYLKKRKNG